MDRTLTKRDIARDTARAFDLVDDVGFVTVTERGAKRWDIVVHQENLADRLAGVPGYTPAAADPPPWPDHGVGPRRTSEQVMAVLDEVRGDR